MFVVFVYKHIAKRKSKHFQTITFKDMHSNIKTTN